VKLHAVTPAAGGECRVAKWVQRSSSGSPKDDSCLRTPGGAREGKSVGFFHSLSMCDVSDHTQLGTCIVFVLIVTSEAKRSQSIRLIDTLVSLLEFLG